MTNAFLLMSSQDGGKEDSNDMCGYSNTLKWLYLWQFIIGTDFNL